MRTIKVVIYILSFVAILISCNKDNLPESEDIITNDLTITKIDALPYKYFYSIDFDSDNNLWMNAIIRDTSVHIPPPSSYLPMKSLLINYDGVIYTVYDGLMFKEMFFDKEDNLWLYSGSRLMTFDKNENKIEVHYTVEDEESYIEKVYLDAQNNIWIEGSKNIGLLKRTNSGWEKQPSPTEYYNMNIDKNGDTYFATLGNRIIKYSDGHSSVIGEESWVDHFVLQRRGLLIDNRNRLWVSAVGASSLKISLAVFENDVWKANNPPFENDEEIYSLETMFLDKKGRIWVQNNIIVNNKIDGNVLFVFEGETWFKYEEITNDYIYDHAFDKNDNLWLTTYNKGIIKINL